mmetsp:Transcript_3060/g.4468  ORF Transcript_3060/g.4468 Transcript_3060/m.4468 type:complete len:269 (-) Transcript_3060:152-958(-)
MWKPMKTKLLTMKMLFTKEVLPNSSLKNVPRETPNLPIALVFLIFFTVKYWHQLNVLVMEICWPWTKSVDGCKRKKERDLPIKHFNFSPHMIDVGLSQKMDSLLITSKKYTLVETIKYLSMLYHCQTPLYLLVLMMTVNFISKPLHFHERSSLQTKSIEHDGRSVCDAMQTPPNFGFNRLHLCVVLPHVNGLSMVKSTFVHLLMYCHVLVSVFLLQIGILHQVSFCVEEKIHRCVIFDSTYFCNGWPNAMSKYIFWCGMHHQLDLICK